MTVLMEVLKMIKETIISILNDIDEEIPEYDGPNLLDDGIIDSFVIMEIVTDVEDKLNIRIDPDDITEAHFKTIDAMIEFVESLSK